MGIPDAEIVMFATDQNADLIVMGSHGRTGISRLVMGSVAEAVMRRARCPVMVVKHPHDHETSEDVKVTANVSAEH